MGEGKGWGDCEKENYKNTACQRPSIQTGCGKMGEKKMKIHSTLNVLDSNRGGGEGEGEGEGEKK